MQRYGKVRYGTGERSEEKALRSTGKPFGGRKRFPGKRSERRSRHKAICPNGMRSFWKVAAFRLTESIRIQSDRRALRCFQNELHHFIILSLKWYESQTR